jgi:hypothetical protein
MLGFALKKKMVGFALEKPTTLKFCNGGVQFFLLLF